jgi:hypothetical protein
LLFFILLHFTRKLLCPFSLLYNLTIWKKVLIYIFGSLMTRFLDIISRVIILIFYLPHTKGVNCVCYNFGESVLWINLLLFCYCSDTFFVNLFQFLAALLAGRLTIGIYMYLWIMESFLHLGLLHDEQPVFLIVSLTCFKQHKTIIVKD